MDTQLKSAINLLAALDLDHATEQNGAGFNKFDGIFGHQLAESETWTPRQERAAWQMLRKYASQLATHGIDYAAIPEPTKPDAKSNPSKCINAADSGKFFAIHFEYDASLVAAVRNLPDRRFDGNGKFWTVAAKAANIDAICEFAEEHGFEISQLARNLMHDLESAEIAKSETRAVNIVASSASDAEIEIDGLGGELRPFQRAGVAYALNARRTFIADEMGLGKTVEALATIHAANAYPALIVCPASLKLNWEREAQKWLPGKSVVVLNGKTDMDFSKSDVIILNYDILKKWLEPLSAIGFAAIICDESHYCKNYKAQRTEAVKSLASKIPMRLLLTGTPILNRPQELLSQLGILNRLNDFGGFWEFAKRYCQAYKSRYGWDFSGAAHLDELNQKLRAHCFVRRNKADVLAELPAKTRALQPVPLSNRREYERAERELITYLREKAANDKAFLASIKDLTPTQQCEAKAQRADTAESKAAAAEQLVRIEALKQLAAQGKLDAIYEWIESFIETGEKLVLFAHHRSIVQAIAEKFQAPAITGETPIEKRQEYVDKFQSDDSCKLIVLNIRAGGVGITLTAASNVAFVEFDWTPAAHDQAEDRCHRIGQTDAVTAWYLLAENTIDDKIHALIESKRAVVDATTDGPTTAKTDSIFDELIDQLTAQN